MHNFMHKKPIEEFVVTMEFQQRMAEVETIDEVTVVAIDNTGNGADVTSSIVDGYTISGQSVLVKVKGGEEGHSYEISITVETSIYDVLKDSFIMAVKEHY